MSLLDKQVLAKAQIDKLFEKHDRVGFLYSGGKDSRAVLELLTPYMDRTVIIWANTGKYLDGVVSSVRDLSKRAAYFMEVRTNRDHYTKHFGRPSDWIPIESVSIGKAFDKNYHPKYVSPYECCMGNIWRGIEQAMWVLDVTGFIKAQREDERFTAPFTTEFILGIGKPTCEMCYPIRHWSADDVRQFLKECKCWTDRYDLEHSSFDCWDCTGYWDVIPERNTYLRRHYPKKRRELAALVREMRDELAKEITRLGVEK